eukprot:scaffold35528_cov150-Skeletonema_dohrnii-CCMP3373.AAC.1
MVTKIVIHVSSEGTGSAEDSNRANDIKHLQKRQDDYSDDNADDKYDAVQGNEEEEIQLCRLQGCLNEAAGGGICDGQSYHDHDVSTQGKLNDDTSDDSIHAEIIDDGAVDICRHKDNSSKKRPLLVDEEGGTEETKRRKRTQPFIDLTDVPPQLPIKNNRKGASSKYQGVFFNKSKKEWKASIMIHGKQHYIGNYENEEEAAVDYARAVFKYEEGKVNARRNIGQKVIDLTDVPPQLPVPKSHGRVGSSRYQGVFFNKSINKWQAKIMLDGKTHSVGNYDDEEEAAVDYARALFKYGSRRKR